MRAIIILLLLTLLPLATASMPIDRAIEVKVHFPVEERCFTGPGEFNLTGEVVFVNPYRKDLTIHLNATSGSWNVSVEPARITVSDERGNVTFTLHVVVSPGDNRTDVIVVSGRWETDEEEGDAIPDTIETFIVPSAEHDSAPEDVRVLAIAGAVAIGTGAAAGYAVKRLLRRFPIPPFYTRLDRDAVMGNSARRKILSEIRTTPGLCVKDLIERTGEARSTILYHLRVLEREGMVATVRDGRVRRVYPSTQAHLKREIEERILEAIARSPGIDISSLSRELGYSKQVISYHVAKMESSRKVWTERDGRMKRCYPRP